MKYTMNSRLLESIYTKRGGENVSAPRAGVTGWSKLKYKHPVFRSGKISKYLKLLINIGCCGMTWQQALRLTGIESKNPGYFCLYRQSMLKSGLIEAKFRVGHAIVYRLTKLGDRYVDAAVKHVH